MYEEENPLTQTAEFFDDLIFFDFIMLIIVYKWLVLTLIRVADSGAL